MFALAIGVTSVVTLLMLILVMLFVENKGFGVIVTIVVAFLTFLLMAFKYGLGMELIRTPLDLGPLWLLIGVIVIGGLITVDMTGSLDRVPGTFYAVVVYVVGLGLFIGADLAANPHESIFCQEDRLNSLVGMLDITIEDERFALDNSDPNRSIVNDEDIAGSMTSDVFGKYASYLKLDAAQHVEVAGRPYIVVDMKPRSYTAFNQKGAIIPGFYLIDPIRLNSSSDIVEAPMSLVPGLEASKSLFPLTLDEYDLTRRVFNEILQPNGWEALDLETLELTDEMQPRFTALLVKPIMGTTGYYADAYLIVDPTVEAMASGNWYEVYDITSNDVVPGQPVKYDVSQVPAWVNNIFPESYFTWWVDMWGSHKFHAVCVLNSQNAGRHMIDNVEDKIMADGHRVYQYSLTSLNPDSAMTMFLYADPRTGAIRGYETIGEYALPNLASINNTFSRITVKDLPPNGLTPSETELTEWNGYLVFTTLLKSVSSTTNDVEEHTYSKYGVVLADNDAIRNDNNFIIAESPNEAYLQFMEHMADIGEADEERDGRSAMVTLTGTVLSVGQPYVDGENSRMSFIMQATDGEVYSFTTVANHQTTLLAVGHQVIVQSLQVDTTEFNRVAEMRNLTLIELTQ